MINKEGSKEVGLLELEQDRVQGGIVVKRFAFSWRINGWVEVARSLNFDNSNHKG